MKHIGILQMDSNQFAISSVIKKTKMKNKAGDK